MCGCDDGLCATDGLPSAADAPLQRSELAKSATSGHFARGKQPCSMGYEGLTVRFFNAAIGPAMAMNHHSLPRDCRWRTSLD